MSDLIKREDATETFAELYDIFDDYPNIVKELHKVYDKILAIPSAENKGEWIPIKWHEITEEEREEEGYSEEWSVFIDSPMPTDYERILVTTKHGEVEIDTCFEDNGFYLDSGWDWVDDIIAWMPLPPAWEGANDERF